MNSNGSDADISNGLSITEEQKTKVDEMRRLLGPLPEKLSLYCTDACIVRYLVARNWNVKKSFKMLKESLQWRLHYKPEEIRWEDIAKEAETGKIFRTNLIDRQGRSVLVLRPGKEMVWWIDYDGFSLSDVSFKAARETAHILQDHYPERLGVAILYNPPKFFEPFWKMVRPFLDPKTREKVKFVRVDDPESTKIIEDILDINKLDFTFFDYDEYAQRMKNDDIKSSSFWKTKDSNGAVLPNKFSDSEESEDSEAKSVEEDTILEANGVHPSN